MNPEKSIVPMLAAILLVLCGPAAHANTIAVIELTTSIADASLAIDDAASSTIILGGGILSLGFSGEDAGNTLQWVADAASAGAAFERFATTVTNGIDNAIEINTAVVSVGAIDYLRAPESEFFADVAGRSGPDLAGFIIDAVTITVTDIEFVTGATNILTARTLYAIEARAVPLPAASWLLFGALGALGALRRRRAHG